MSQTYTNFELLVVNDCSTDRTAELVKSIAAKDSRVRLISNVKIQRCVLYAQAWTGRSERFMDLDS
ncbi:MAG: glycosyltransferase family 2 protein [Faecalibacterium sp.]